MTGRKTSVFSLGRILTGLATAAAALVGAALGAPALMNWDHLRAPVEARAAALLGAPVRIDGRVTVQLLPAPVLSLGDVVVEPAAGSAFSGDFAQAHVRLALKPLLSGKAVPAALSLSGADLVVDRDLLADGARTERPAIPIDVRGGHVRFDAGGAVDLAGLSLSVRPRRNGGANIQLSGAFENTPFSLRAVWRDVDAAAVQSLALDFGEGEAVLSLVRDGQADGSELQVRLRRGGKVAAFLGRVLPAAGNFVTPEQIASLAPLSMVLRSVPEGDAFILRGIEIVAGQLRLTGEGRFVPAARPRLDLQLGARTLVLGNGDGFDPSALLRALGHIAEWGGHLDGGLRLHADHMLAGGAVLRRTEVALRFGQEGARLDRFRTMAGRGLVLSGQGIPAGPGQLGVALRLDGARLGDLSAGTKPAGPAAGDAPLTMEGQLVISGTRAVLSRARIAAGQNFLNGEAVLFSGERTVLELRAEAGELDLRPYGIGLDDLTAELSADSLAKLAHQVAQRADITARLELPAARLTDVTVRNGVLDFALDRNQLVLRRLSFEQQGKRTVEARLRLPFETKAESGQEPAAAWTERAEAAIDARPEEGTGGFAWRAGLWDGVLNIETETPVRSRLSGRLSRQESGFRWTEIKGRIGKASVSGQLELISGDRPVLRGAVSAERAAIRFAGGPEGDLWPGWAIADYWPESIDIHLDWSAGALEVAGAPFTDAAGTAVLENGEARLILDSGALYGGASSGTASLVLGTDGIAAWEGQGVLQRADLNAVMGGGWQGRGLVRLSASGSGKSIADIVSGLRGALGLNFDEGRIGGFDAAALAAALPKLKGDEATGAVERAFGAGATPFRRLEGEAKISNGELTLSGISAQTESGPVMLAGVVNLPARLIAAQADILLGAETGAPLSVQFIGRLEAPERMVNTERLAKRSRDSGDSGR